MKKRYVIFFAGMIFTREKKKIQINKMENYFFLPII